MLDMLCGTSALILEWAISESPWVFENPRLSDLFQNCLFHFFVEDSKKRGTYSTALNLSKNLTQGFLEFSRDCENSLRVLRYGSQFKTAPHPTRMSSIRALPEVTEFSKEFPFFFERADNLRHSAV
jgi:hypothetical protein